MELLINNIELIVGSALVSILVIISTKVIYDMNRGKVNKSSYPTPVEVDPSKILKEIYMAPVFDQVALKEKYLGLYVEIRAILNRSIQSDLTEDHRDFRFNYEDDHSIYIIGSLDISQYDDRSWMRKGGKVNILGEIESISEAKLRLKNLTILQ